MSQLHGLLVFCSLRQKIHLCRFSSIIVNIDLLAKKVNIIKITSTTRREHNEFTVIALLQFSEWFIIGVLRIGSSPVMSYMGLGFKVIGCFFF